MNNYNTPREATSLGGQNAQSILYRCPVCKTMGYGSRYVNKHLTNGCKGPGKKTLQRQDEFVGREQEATLNTAVFNATKMIRDERDAFKEMKARIQADIETIRELGEVNASNLY